MGFLPGIWGMTWILMHFFLQWEKRSGWTFSFGTILKYQWWVGRLTTWFVPEHWVDESLPTFLWAWWWCLLRGLTIESLHGDACLFSWDGSFQAYFPAHIPFWFCEGVLHHGEPCQQQRSWTRLYVHSHSSIWARTSSRSWT